MRTFFLTCTWALLLFPCIVAQDLAQLSKTIDDNVPKVLPDDLGRKAVSQELVDACNTVIEAANQIYALPDLEEQTRRRTVQREAVARIILSYNGAPAHYARLVALCDELNQWGNPNFAKLTEEHVLKIGMLLATQTGNNAINIDVHALAERMVMFVEQHPGPGSMQIIDLFYRQVNSMKPHYRDRRLAVIAPIFQDFYRRVNHAARADALDADIRRATLQDNTMLLYGVSIDGSVFNPASLRDKVVLVQFWGTWCAPCKAEMPQLIDLYEKYRKDGFEIIGINTNTSGDDEKKVRQFVDTTLFNGKKIPWRILHEGLSERQYPNRETVTKYYGITELPVLVLIGRDGKVRNLHPLPSTLDSLVAEATSLQARFDDWTEEEKKQMEENEKRRQEEIDLQLIQRRR